jgi:hypothetical protein
MKRLLPIILLFTFMFSSCSTSKDEIAKSVEETITARISSETPLPKTTPTLIPNTATSTYTIIPTLTFTPTPTPTLDIRIIDSDPEKLLCKKTDLPLEGKYRIPGSGWMSINTNDEVIQARGTEKGRDYIISTGRVTGWWANFLRGSSAVQLPEQIVCGVYMFKTIEGAQLALSKYNAVETSEVESNESYAYINNILGLGDKDISYVYYRLKRGGNREIDYSIEFTYKNLLISVDGYSAVETDVKSEDLEKIGHAMLERIQNAELVNPDSALWPK